MTGEEWADEYCRHHKLVWEDLSTSERMQIIRMIPCNVRCWRVGVPIPTTPGQPCDECGRIAPIPTAWERIVGTDIL